MMWMMWMMDDESSMATFHYEALTHYMLLTPPPFPHSAPPLSHSLQFLLHNDDFDGKVLIVEAQSTAQSRENRETSFLSTSLTVHITYHMHYHYHLHPSLPPFVSPSAPPIHPRQPVRGWWDAGELRVSVGERERLW